MIYTVVGLINDADELLVAGVFEGEQNAKDGSSSSGEYGEYDRWADSFEADSPDEAEAMAQRAVAGEDDEDDD